MLTPTQEQLELSQSKANLILMSAFAGTGKTSTLVFYAKAHPNTKMVYIAFNASVKDEAKSKFPPNVRCVTGHGFAYGKYGVPYAKKLNNPKPYHLTSALNIDIRVADLVIKAVNNYLSSPEYSIEQVHVAGLVGIKEQANLITYAKKAWDMMCDVDNTSVPMPHDGYLKLFQINGGTINTEVILFDEAQDASPVMIAIIEASKAKKIFVGDDNQAIYGFRGAVNAMADIQKKADAHLYLTASFRFGAGIATLANKVLNEYRTLAKPLRGLGKHATSFYVDTSNRHTRLARTNATLFSEAVKAYKSNRPFGFVGNIKNYGFDSITDAYYLSIGKKGDIKDPTIRTFKTYADMVGYAEVADDKELKAKIKIVSEYQSAIPSLVSGVTAKAIDDLSKVDIILTTAHKSKGLEWDSVYLTDDFCDMLEKSEDGEAPEVPDREEINLLYVAITRAERCLSVHESLHKWLEKVHYFEPIYDRKNSL